MFGAVRKSGLLFILKPDLVLVLERSLKVSEPGSWGLPGGHLHQEEGPYHAAIRECQEEIGKVPLHEVIHTDVAGDYATFFVQTPTLFEAVLNEEHTQWAWVKASDPPELRWHPSMPRLLSLVPGLLKR